MLSPAFFHSPSPGPGTYVDKANLIARARESGDKVFSALFAGLRLKGFVLRDEIVPSQNFEFLGVVLDGTSGRLRHTARRCWRLWYALTKVLQVRRAIGDAPRVLEEHVCRHFGLFPPALSVLEEICPPLRAKVHVGVESFANVVRKEVSCPGTAPPRDLRHTVKQHLLQENSTTQKNCLHTPNRETKHVSSTLRHTKQCLPKHVRCWLSCLKTQSATQSISQTPETRLDQLHKCHILTEHRDAHAPAKCTITCKIRHRCQNR